MRVSVGKNTRPRASEPKKPLIGDPVTTYGIFGGCDRVRDARMLP